MQPDANLETNIWLTAAGGDPVNAIENNDVMKMFCAVLKLSRTTEGPKNIMRAVPKKGEATHSSMPNCCACVCVRVLM